MSGGDESVFDFSGHFVRLIKHKCSIHALSPMHIGRLAKRPYQLEHLIVRSLDSDFDLQKFNEHPSHEYTGKNQ